MNQLFYIFYVYVVSMTEKVNVQRIYLEYALNKFTGVSECTI